MDSMRSLNKSLPTSHKQRSAQPPEQLIQAFKTAALSVTNLYKTAASDQTRAREAGYQDALDDVLAFLDKENLGLGDGEGWRVRQWATGRLDGTLPAHAGSDTDDDRGETEKRTRSSSPAAQRKECPDLLVERHHSRSSSPARTAPTSATMSEPVQTQVTAIKKSEVFSFRSSIPYPQDMEVQAVDPANVGTSPSEGQIQPTATTSTPAVRVEVVPRGSRTPHRNGNHTNRHNTRSATTTRSIGSGAGPKRKLQFGDFFDIGSLGDGKDGFGGGGKRSRFT